MRGQVRITEMYAFVMVDDDGTEGVPAFNGPGGVVLPMVGTDTARIDSLRPVAEAMAAQMGKPIELIRFTLREQIDVIRP